MWVSHTAMGLPFRSRSGNSVIVVPNSVRWAPPVYSCSSGTSAICSGTASRATTPMNSQSRPLKSIHAKA